METLTETVSEANEQKSKDINVTYDLSQKTQNNSTSGSQHVTVSKSSKNFKLEKSDNAELQTLMYSTNREHPKGDVDLFENMFLAWKNQESSNGSKEKEISQRLDMSEKRKFNTDSKVADLEKTVELLQKTVYSLHNELNLIDEFGKENTELKDIMKVLGQKIISQKSEIENLCLDYDKQIKETNIKHETEIEAIKGKANSQIKQNEKDVSNKLQEKQRELETMKLEIDKLEKEKKTEIAVLTVEYENKVAKIQRQKAVTSMNLQQTSSSNQEIFRKKLQHLKSEHEHELNGLREQLRNLQSQLAAQSNQGQKQQVMQFGRGQNQQITQSGTGRVQNQQMAQSGRGQSQAHAGSGRLAIQSGRELYNRQSCSPQPMAAKRVKKF